MRISDWSSDVCSFDLAQAAEKRAWPEILKVAEGQAVYWNAWGGDARVNAYIAWVGDQVKERYRITLHHVKLADTADAVSRVVAERAAGKEHGGSIDLIWINGENFAAMKAQELLYGPFTDRSEEHTSELQSLMRISYAVFCLK